MIQRIEIIIRTGLEETMNALVIFSKNTCYINNKKIEVSNEFKDKLVKTICLWKNEYGEDERIDSEEFLITVIAEDGKTTFHGKGIYPRNYQELKEMLGDLK